MNEPLRHLDDDACASLALGLATPEEHVRAVTHARSCAVCESRLRAHVGSDVRARADLAIRPVLSVVEAPRRRVGWQILVATAAAAAVVAVFVMRGPSPPTAVAPPWLPAPGAMVQTRSEEPVDDALRRGLEAYARHDLPAAISALRSARAQGGAEQARRLYLGHALLVSGQTEEARAWLESVDVDALPDPWRGEAERSLAAAWRLTGRTRQADSIESVPGH